MLKKILIAALLGITSFGAEAQNKNISFRSRVPYNNLSNIWGFKDSTGREYALAGAWNNLSIVDVTNPDAPFIKYSIPGASSAWREIRTMDKFAYVTTEGGGGVTIVDMRFLPDTVYYKYYTGNGAVAGAIDQIHALHIDNQKLYLYGGNLQGGRAKIFSLADPWNPTYLGTVSNSYVHDGYVKNDTLYSCQIYRGELVIIDATNPQNPREINTQLTPSAFTHNSWLSTDNKVVYTTDEVEASYVTAYDISDIHNIKELDRYKHNNSGSIAHNTYVLNDSSITGFNNDFLWTSYYTDGITLVDAGRPHNLIEIANYDSSPSSGSGFDGAWGVYPYLPSGNILVSDIENGMHVVTPIYRRACYLEGEVRNTNTNDLIANAKFVLLEDTSKNTLSNLDGSFAFGTADSGSYSLVTSLFGYINDTSVVQLRNGVLTNLLVKLMPITNFNLSETIIDTTSNPIPSVDVYIKNNTLGNVYQIKSNVNGMINIPNFYSGDYTIRIGKFGYITKELNHVNIQSVMDFPELILQKGYYDDFLFMNSWTTIGDPDNGGWVRGIPIKTTSNSILANPDSDVDHDFGEFAFVTENIGGPATFGDVDNGEVILQSPTLDLSTYTNPHIHFSRYFSNLSSGSTPNDTFTVSITNGVNTIVLEKIWGNRSDNATWVDKSIALNGRIALTNTMKVIVKAEETPSDHIVEAGFDKFFISDSSSVVGINSLKSIYEFDVYPNPSNGVAKIQYGFQTLYPNASIECFDVLGTKVFSKNLSLLESEIELNLETRGLHFIKLKNGSEEKTIKFIVQ